MSVRITLLAASLALAGCAQIRDGVRDGYNAINPPLLTAAACARKHGGGYFYEKCLGRACRINPAASIRCGHGMSRSAARLNAYNDAENRARADRVAARQRAEDEQRHRETIEAQNAQIIANQEIQQEISEDLLEQQRQINAVLLEEREGEASGLNCPPGYPCQINRIAWPIYRGTLTMHLGGIGIGPYIQPGEGGVVGGR